MCSSDLTRRSAGMRQRGVGRVRVTERRAERELILVGVNRGCRAQRQEQPEHTKKRAIRSGVTPLTWEHAALISQPIVA